MQYPFSVYLVCSNHPDMISVAYDSTLYGGDGEGDEQKLMQINYCLQQLFQRQAWMF